MNCKYLFILTSIAIICSCKTLSSTSQPFKFVDSILLIYKCDDLKKIKKEDYLKIKTLSIYDVKCEINEAISEFKNLKEISINARKLNFGSIQTVFDSLKILNIYDSESSNIPDFVFLQKNIERLGLSLKNENSIDFRFDSFKRLKSLYLTFNNLKILPDELFDLVSLREVIIYTSSDKVLELPNKISNLSSLETLAFPFDFSSGYQNLKAIPNIKELIIPKLKPINGSYDFLKDYTFLESIKITDISREEKYALRKEFPNGLKLY